MGSGEEGAEWRGEKGKGRLAGEGGRRWLGDREGERGELRIQATEPHLFRVGIVG